MDDSRIEARWVVDSETGIRYLIELHTNKVLMIGTPEEPVNGWNDEGERTYSTDYDFGFEAGYTLAEEELHDIICELEQEILELQQRIFDLGDGK